MISTAPYFNSKICIDVFLTLLSVIVIGYSPASLGQDACDAKSDCKSYTGGKCANKFENYSVCECAGFRCDGVPDQCDDIADCQASYGVNVDACADDSTEHSVCVCNGFNCADPGGDNDGDGVNNNFDQCQYTPAGYHVSNSPPNNVYSAGANEGCAEALLATPTPTPVPSVSPTPVPSPSVPPGDADGDGVANAMDQCPETDASLTVDAVGCPILVDIGIANGALELGVPVKPNVMILADDSFSMDVELMIEGQVEGVFFPVVGQFWEMDYLYHFDNYFPYDFPWGQLVPSQEALNIHPDFGVNMFGVWRLRNSNYNTIYYDPKVRYIPWVNHADSNPLAALYDPTQPASTPVDLTVPISYQTPNVSDPADDLNPITVDTVNFYMPRYYVWTGDANFNGVVDETEVAMDGSGAPIPVLIDAASAPFTDGSADRTDCVDPFSCTYAEELQNFANWFTYYRKREYAAKAALSRVVERQSNIRMGMATINSDSSTPTRIEIKDLNNTPSSGAKFDLLNMIYSISDNGFTPLRRALEKAGNYFECVGDNTFETAASAPGTASCPVLSAADGGACQQNYTILVSDGAWSGTDPSVGDADADDLSNDYDGNNFADLTAIPNTLADVAMHYYKRDLHALDDKVPTTVIDRQRGGARASDETMHQHMATYTVGFGVDGTISSMPNTITETIDWTDPTWLTPNKINDMRHASYNGRGEYYSSTNPTQLISQLTEVFEQIKAGSGVAAAVSFNTQSLQSGTKIFRASYNSLLNNGDLKAYEVALDGTISNTRAWSAAENLDGAARRIITFNKDNAFPSLSTGVPFEHANLSTEQQAVLSLAEVAYLRGDRSTEPTAGALRKRELTEGLLGDIVHSAPLFVGEPTLSANRLSRAPYPAIGDDRYSVFKENNQTRKGIVYVGANDGMLHAFNAETGVEEFAYIPNRLINDAASSGMLDQFSDPNYVHRFFVDLTPAVQDIFIDSPAVTGSAKNWRTILMGGLGAGGKGYYALDVTKPTTFASEADAAKNVMWEFTDEDDIDLGNTYSPPLMVMTNVSESAGINKWVAIFGNGYNSKTGIAKLFILDIEEGNDGHWETGDYIEISTGVGPDASGRPNGLSTPRGVDIDSNGTIDMVYAGDLRGNMYRFDLTGGMATWGVTKVYSAVDAFGNEQPITTRPVVVREDPTKDELIVVFSTGSWMTTADATSSDIQSIYGILDDGATGLNRGDLVEQEYTTVQHTVTDAQTGLTNTFEGRILSDNTVNYNSRNGWFIDLDVLDITGTFVENPGERAVRKMQISGEFGFVSSIFPHTSFQCDAAGGGALLAFNLKTGGSGSSLTPGALFDLNRDGIFNATDMPGGNVMAGIVFDSTPTDTTMLGDFLYGQTADQDVFFFKVAKSKNDKSGRLSWRELRRRR